LNDVDHYELIFLKLNPILTCLKLTLGSIVNNPIKMAQKNKTYREAIEEIEEILGNIENDELEVDDLVDKVKKVTELLKFCKDKLYKTQEEVEKALKEMEG
jgi:exodeoxyribonuclease VII small subunit